MDQIDTNNQLQNLYAEWKSRLSLTEEQAHSLSPPLLLQVTEQYCLSRHRVIVFGQETTGWGWNQGLRTSYPDYPHDWPYQGINSMSDFLSNSDSVEGLCWGYQEFSFARRQPTLARTPFWQAFNFIHSWPDIGIMWNNIVKSDYAAPGASWSILQAPEDTKEAFVTQQASLLVDELKILDPHVCLFLTGPYYDPVIEAAFPELELTICADFPRRELARVVDDGLPARSFRTYHPKYLRLSGRWSYLDSLKAMSVPNTAPPR